jgi:hypothetical protein
MGCGKHKKTDIVDIKLDQLVICSVMTQNDYDEYFDGMLECIPNGFTVYLCINGQSDEEYFKHESDYKHLGKTIKQYRMGWHDLDFSAIKNRLLEEVKEDWVLYLNADDRLCYNPNHLDVSEYPKEVGGVKCMVNMIENNKLLTIPTFKLFRSNLRYHGAVHEGIAQDLSDKGYMAAISCLAIEHIGYLDPQKNIEKAYRNLQIMLRDKVDIADKRTQWHIKSSLNILSNSDYFKGAIDVG